MGESGDCKGRLIKESYSREPNFPLRTTFFCLNWEEAEERKGELSSIFSRGGFVWVESLAEIQSTQAMIDWTFFHQAFCFKWLLAACTLKSWITFLHWSTPVFHSWTKLWQRPLTFYSEASIPWRTNSFWGWVSLSQFPWTSVEEVKWQNFGGIFYFQESLQFRT